MSLWIHIKIVNQELYFRHESHGIFCEEDEFKETHNFQVFCSHAGHCVHRAGPCAQHSSLPMLPLLGVKSILYSEMEKISHFCPSTLASVLKGIPLTMLVMGISFSFRLWVTKEFMKSRNFPILLFVLSPCLGSLSSGTGPGVTEVSDLLIGLGGKSRNPSPQCPGAWFL